MKLFVSEDGKYIAGVKYGKKTPATPSCEEQEYSEAEVIVPPVKTGDDYFDKVIDSLRQASRAEYINKARAAEQKAEEISAEIQKLREKRIRLKKRQSFFKRTVGEHMLIYAVIGFFVGILTAVLMVLEWHGPTVTPFGTFAAAIIYLLGGIAFAAGFAWLARQSSMGMVEAYDRDLGDLMEDLEDLTNEKIRLQENATKYNEVAWQQ